MYCLWFFNLSVIAFNNIYKSDDITFVNNLYINIYKKLWIVDLVYVGTMNLISSIELFGSHWLCIDFGIPHLQSEYEI